jgi:flagellar hook-associated protein 2
VSKGAVAGSYSLEVTALAKNQRLATQTAFASSATFIGQGTLEINLGQLKSGAYTADSTRKLSITIDSTNNTLGGLRDAINAKNGGVSATIVTGDAGAQLVLTAKDTGNKNVIQITAPDVGGATSPLQADFAYDPVSASGGFTQATAKGGQAAQDATFLLNGIAASSSSNTVSGVLDGVTLTLNHESVSGTATKLNVSVSSSNTLVSALTAFVKAYNDANTTMGQLGAYDAKTKTAGTLQGQSVLRSSQAQVRNLVFGTTAGGDSKYQRLSNIGITVAKDGSMSLDSSKLSSAITADYAGVTTLVEKVGKSFKTSIESLAGTTGSITSVSDSTTSMIKSLGTQATAMQRRLDDIQARYTKQFTALDTTVASLNKIGSYLTQQLANLPSTSGK